ncbi:hypothetical protein T439DRAFT_346977 [Meredithblackwellia eburnea MCA 4105]
MVSHGNPSSKDQRDGRAHHHHAVNTQLARLEDWKEPEPIRELPLSPDEVIAEYDKAERLVRGLGYQIDESERLRRQIMDELEDKDALDEYHVKFTTKWAQVPTQKKEDGKIYLYPKGDPLMKEWEKSHQHKAADLEWRWEAARKREEELRPGMEEAREFKKAEAYCDCQTFQHVEEAMDRYRAIPPIMAKMIEEQQEAFKNLIKIILQVNDKFDNVKAKILDARFTAHAIQKAKAEDRLFFKNYVYLSSKRVPLHQIASHCWRIPLKSDKERSLFDVKMKTIETETQQMEEELSQLKQTLNKIGSSHPAYFHCAAPKIAFCLPKLALQPAKWLTLHLPMAIYTDWTPVEQHSNNSQSTTKHVPHQFHPGIRNPSGMHPNVVKFSHKQYQKTPFDESVYGFAPRSRLRHIPGLRRWGQQRKDLKHEKIVKEARSKHNAQQNEFERRHYVEEEQRKRKYDAYYEGLREMMAELNKLEDTLKILSRCLAILDNVLQQPDWYAGQDRLMKERDIGFVSKQGFCIPLDTNGNLLANQEKAVERKREEFFKLAQRAASNFKQKKEVLKVYKQDAPEP